MTQLRGLLWFPQARIFELFGVQRVPAAVFAPVPGFPRSGSCVHASPDSGPVDVCSTGCHTCRAVGAVAGALVVRALWPRLVSVLWFLGLPL